MGELNLATIIVLALLILAVGAAVVYMTVKRRSNKGCGYDCSFCAMRSTCHDKNREKCDKKY